MKLKLLLFSLLFSCGILSAQDTIKTLLITESRMTGGDVSYIELTNMGTDPVNLKTFELGVHRPWSPAPLPWTPEADRNVMLPDHVLQPGESFVVASASDYVEEMYAYEVSQFEYSPHWWERSTQKEMWDIADMMLHRPEQPTGPNDSIHPNHWIMSDVWNGRECWWIKQYIYTPTDTVVAVIDQVGGVFDVDGHNSDAGAYDVAGVTGATANCILIRKFSVKEGNLVFDRGTDLTDSEWIPIPTLGGGSSRSVFWTTGNHGDFTLNETTITSSVLDIDWVNSEITVPWGIRRDDSIMYKINKTPGIAWGYDYAENHDDSAYVSIRTGDVLTLYACGNDREMVEFTLQVAPPTTGANIVIPKRHQANGDNWVDAWTDYIVTDGVPGMDTIKNVFYGERVDTLFKYLEKAPNADWEIVWVDDTPRADLKKGDILKVTAENGTVKEYYIKVFRYRKSLNAYLGSITWPDIPEYYKDVFGWVGDTIPNFARAVWDYSVQVPFDVDGIPALVPKLEDINAKVAVSRAKNLGGTVEDRTYKFTTTAEDDTTIYVYQVQLNKEKNPSDIQPWSGDPFISEFVFWDQWSNSMIEIANPGTVPLDLSDYMFVGNWGYDPAAIITWFGEATTSTWMNRFCKYIPGYKWVDSTTWKVTPAIAVQDLNVNPIVQPGDVFVMSGIWTEGQLWSNNAYRRWNWPGLLQADVVFYEVGQPNFGNPWNEPVGGDGVWFRHWSNSAMYMYKILNDSIKLGLKPALDPNDFELLESFSMGQDANWVIGGDFVDMITHVQRRPEIYYPNPVAKGSFGTTDVTTPPVKDGEWNLYDWPYYTDQGAGWPLAILLICQDLGKHFMNEVTIFKSTVASTVYIVSSGFSMDETIRGVVEGTTVDQFLDNIIKADADQTLTLKDGVAGTVLTGTDVLTDEDVLEVLAADSIYTSAYILDVTAEGLSDNAVLTSTEYTIGVTGATGTVSGMEYGTLLKDVVENVTLPAFARMFIIDVNDAAVPLLKLNFDTMYVDATVNDQIFFEVIAEDGLTKIVYQLVPTATASDAFVVSDVFTVHQDISLIELIPQGTTVQGFMANIIPVTGATMMLVDKNGMERTFGELYKDDRLIVTSEDGETEKVYYLSLLPAWVGETADYLAYVTSSVYTVDQKNLAISDATITDITTISYFLARLVPSTGATMMVVDGSGNQQSGDLDIGDQLKVTAGNGVNEAYYSITVLPVSLNDLGSASIQIYPNPSSGYVYISGLQPGNRIRIMNILGASVVDRVAYQSDELISLENQSGGVYFVVISDEDTIVGRYKLIIK